MKTKILAAALMAACALAHAGIVARTRGDAASAPASAASAGMRIEFASSDNPAKIATDPDDIAAINQAASLIQSRQPQAAIDRFLDPLIARLDARYRDVPDKLYCANTMPEAMMYALQAAATNTNTAVVDGALCNAYFMRGFAELDLGKITAAQADYDRVIALSPSNPHFLNEVGQFHSRMRDWAGALGYFHRAEEASKAFSVEGRMNAELGLALRGIGYVDVELGKLDEAEAAYRRCIEIDANDRQAKAELGYVLNLRAEQIGLGK